MPENVTQKQRLAIAALLSGLTLDKTAEAAGVDPRTVYRWRSEKAFMAALEDAQSELSRAASRRLAGMLSKSIDQVEGLLNTDTLAPVDRLRAINTIFRIFERLHDITVINERIDRLEENLLNDK